MGVARQFPWWIKLTAKLVLARLPIPYSFWRSLGLFRHGEMNQPEHAIATFYKYYDRAKQYSNFPERFETLELGPGDSILSGLVARAAGASHAWLVDAGNFATTDVSVCKRTTELLRAQGAIPPVLEGKAVPEMLRHADIRYLTSGTTSLAEIPDSSIHLVWSQVVLEHVPHDEFRTMAKEMHRIMAPDGIGVHSIDFRDHLSGKLNNLRFSHRIWESHYFRNSGFYTNRLRPREMLEIFEEAGFTVEVVSDMRWNEIPTPKNRMAGVFRRLPDDDFLIAEMDIVLRPRHG